MFYHNARLAYDLFANRRHSVGVEKAPLISSSTDTMPYDLLRRRVYAGIHHKF